MQQVKEYSILTRGAQLMQYVGQRVLIPATWYSSDATGKRVFDPDTWYSADATGQRVLDPDTWYFS